VPGQIWPRLAASLAIAAIALAGCQSPANSRVARGLIIDLRTRDVAHADSIVLQAESGEVIHLKVADSVQFTPGHLRDHMLSAEPVTVTYVNSPDGALATVITD
jgi:hypothetical protein